MEVDGDNINNVAEYDDILQYAEQKAQDYTGQSASQAAELEAHSAKK